MRPEKKISGVSYLLDFTADPYTAHAASPRGVHVSAHSKVSRRRKAGRYLVEAESGFTFQSAFRPRLLTTNNSAPLYA